MNVQGSEASKADKPQEKRVKQKEKGIGLAHISGVRDYIVWNLKREIGSDLRVRLRPKTAQETPPKSRENTRKKEQIKK